MGTDHRTLHNRVLAVLGPAIAAGEYATGHTFTLQGLEVDFGVSRTVAREAVRVLESMRLVVSRPRTGIRVRPMPDWNIFDPQLIRWRLAGSGRMEQLRSLNELRSAVEPGAAALAAQRGDAQARAHLVVVADEMVRTGRAGDLDTFLELDIAFHRQILELSGNEMLVGLSQVVSEVLVGRTSYDLMPRHPRPEALRLHKAVAQAIRDGLPDVAEAAMRAIVTEVVEALEDDPTRNDEDDLPV
ncbi:FadR/GntR family transcriptional regulator [Nocardiopsis changdeensis]|uniref:FadR family transcriptional regulator n=1 Tax=Nocardiopsis changdeensis TaxID=2831969 RepID=A0ABX8BT63_9ACTN|nr:MULTISPECIES: FCD domain-containing protein [Nocardiopsis]QUX23938.1 FadR family transcriptional regulator [Nocardiopsis changdeensis]QYX39884.1 FCD domain-containing protein [Nocardiopsis sp. MT53]